MLYKILADIVVVVHFLWILFLIFGAYWGIRHKAVKIVHIAGLAFAFILNVFDWYCPFTHLEVWLRARHDPALSYTGSFIIHYVEKVVYIELSGNIIFLFTISLCGINTWLYLRKKRG
ncbi:MAG: DUF2784 family protein [Nitrospiraceae bacterium]|jgi:Protein of Unknown function (DUF2784)|nr:MAG: DUF2784 family protein [Nitrospiraceae bacterium]